MGGGLDVFGLTDADGGIGLSDCRERGVCAHFQEMHIRGYLAQLRQLVVQFRSYQDKPWRPPPLTIANGR
jgi:hypothetical protein